MLFLVRIDIALPPDMPAEEVADLRAREIAYERQFMAGGEWLHIWRIAGEKANVSVLDVASNDRLHEILSGLPMFPWLDIQATPLAKHPSALD